MFSTFPEFTALHISDRDEYVQLTHNYPALSDLSFATLMIWWNFSRDVKVARLNENLVIYYHLPGDRSNTGYCLVGTNEIDKSIQTIFKELKKNNSSVKLVHVPEFTINNLVDAEMYNLSEEDDYKEYIIPVSNLFPLSNLEGKRRRAIGRFFRDLGEDSAIETREIDLSSKANQNELLEWLEHWLLRYGSPNDARGSEKNAMRRSIRESVALDTHNICLYINGKLSGLIIYQITQDGQYLIGNHMKGNKDLYAIYDYLEHCIASKAAELGVPYLNFEMDLGIEGLRQHKSRLHPSAFHKKYRVTPIG